MLDCDDRAEVPQGAPCRSSLPSTRSPERGRTGRPDLLGYNVVSRTTGGRRGRGGGRRRTHRHPGGRPGAVPGVDLRHRSALVPRGVPGLDGFAPLVGGMLRWLGAHETALRTPSRSCWTATPVTTTPSPSCSPWARPASTAGITTRSATAPSRTRPECAAGPRARGSPGRARRRGGPPGRCAAELELGNYVHGASGLDGPELPEPRVAPVG